jgi:UDP-glucose 4-epimerase
MFDPAAPRRRQTTRAVALRVVKALVTGGAGFIGSHLVRALLERGDDVRVLDNFSTGRHRNLEGLEPHIEVMEGDLRSDEQVLAATRGVEVVFHQAALPSVPRSVRDPRTTAAVNVQGTLNVLLAAMGEGVRRVVVASSSSIYGNSGPLPRDEAATPDPVSPYAVSKLAAERYCVSFSRVYSLDTVALRYFNVYGQNQDPASQYAAVVPRFISAIQSGRPVEVYGDGRQSRDFTYVADVVAANLLASEAEDVNGAVINVASGRSTTVNALAEIIGELLGREVEKEHLPSRSGEVRRSWADVGEARRRLGYEPAFTLEEGLRLSADPFVEVSRSPR